MSERGLTAEASLGDLARSVEPTLRGKPSHHRKSEVVVPKQVRPPVVCVVWTRTKSKSAGLSQSEHRHHYSTEAWASPPSRLMTRRPKCQCWFGLKVRLES